MEYIGIDVHKVHSQVCIRTESGEYQERRIRTERQRLREVFAGRPAGRVLIEASTESEWVAQCLEEFGHAVVVVDPNFGPMYGNRSSRIKTDLRDARMLCEAARLGSYRAAHRCSPKSRHLRTVLIVRHALVKTRSRYISVIRTLLRQEGLRVRSGAAASFPQRVQEVRLPAALKEQIAPLLDVLEALNAKIADADGAVAEHAGTDVHARRLQTFPGVGPVTAAAFVSTLDTHERFEKASQVRAFLGLVPKEYSSGESTHRGRITKAGNSRLRALLVEVAWSVLRARSQAAARLRGWGTRVALRRGKVSRRLPWPGGLQGFSTRCGVMERTSHRSAWSEACRLSDVAANSMTQLCRRVFGRGTRITPGPHLRAVAVDGVTDRIETKRAQGRRSRFIARTEG
jgi:transposase